jgi:phenol hydroxylase P1 protein
MATRKTFVWLSGRKRPPSEYEELSTGIQWSGEPVSRTTIGQWRSDSTALSTDWNAFRDPAGMYYRNYVAGQDAAEKQLDAVVAIATDADFVSALDADWRESLTVLVGAMSFAQWGASMAMQHVMRFTLSPTVACAVQLQIMDKLRAAERSVEWFELLHPDAAEGALHGAWDDVAAVQPLRKYVEEILVEQDWGQVVVAVNLAWAGLFEPFLRELYVHGGRANGDFTTAALGTHFAKDASRAVAWTDAFVKQCIAGPGKDGAGAAEEANQKVLGDWLDRYVPAAAAAMDTLALAYPAGGAAVAAASTARSELRARLEKVEAQLSENVVVALAVAAEPA